MFQTNLITSLLTLLKAVDTGRLKSEMEELDGTSETKRVYEQHRRKTYRPSIDK